ncbi:MAG: MGMT family protein [Phycisphaerales bacterium]|nr:MGMT family protein [Phycisphaerales bacterium]
MPSGTNIYKHIYTIIRRIPKGKVATYGQVAELAGLGGHARQVGYALHAMPDDAGIPWHRVVNAKGEISTGAGSGKSEQQLLLEAEGVVFNDHSRIPLRTYRWQHDSASCLT